MKQKAALYFYYSLLPGHVQLRRMIDECKHLENEEDLEIRIKQVVDEEIDERHIWLKRDMIMENIMLQDKADFVNELKGLVRKEMEELWQTYDPNDPVIE